MKRIFVCFARMAVIGLWALASAQSVSIQKSAAPAKKSAREFATLQLEEQIPVPNVAGRLDHFTADDSTSASRPRAARQPKSGRMKPKTKIK